MNRLTFNDKLFGWQLRANITVSGDCGAYNDAMRRLAAYEETGLEPDEINALHERLNAEDAKVGKWPVFVPGSMFHGAKIVGADYESRTVTLDWRENGGANEAD